MRGMARTTGVLSTVLLLATIVARAAPGPPRSQDTTTPAAAAQAAAPLPEKVAYCLGCHEDKDLKLELKDGTSMSLYVDAGHIAKSVHAGQLICTDCHAKYEENHPAGATFDSQRAYTIGAYELCKKCHFDTYTRTLESVHYDLLKSGFEGAPMCVDCHGAHDIGDPRAKRAMMSRSCAACHTATYDAYAKSVHGSALVNDNNQDVPACADCHTHHQVQHPATAKFRLGAPDACVRCHGDEKLMAKYGISTTVAQTYLSDFHGVTASLSRNLPESKQQVVVTCNNCHGVHDIVSPKLKGREAMQATVAASCQQCHAGSTPNFPAAWLSHYPPSLQHAPLVWGVGLFYRFFIPFAVIGLCMHLLLHVYRMSSGR